MRTLYSYFRSSASYRVRIALNLKGLDYQTVPVHLLRGEQRAAGYRAVNPAGLVPALVEEGQALTQSLAIMEYLDEAYPQPPLLPGTAAERARVRALALTVACEIHPLNNTSVLRYLKDTLGVHEDAKMAWVRHWVEQGLATLEQLLAADSRTGACCHGDAPTLADCCLVPQIFNAQRFACRLDHLPTVMRIHDHCLGLEAFQRAAPGAQPDAE
jgi:maleylacetoacetate isomerase